VAAHNAARAPRKSMIPVEELMAMYAHQHVVGAPKSFQRGLTTLKAVASSNEHLHQAMAATMKSLDIQVEGDEDERSDAAASSTLRPRTTKEVSGAAVRALLPCLRKELNNTQNSEKAHADFQHLAAVRESLDDLRQELRSQDADNHVRMTLLKHEDLRNMHLFQMATHKNDWQKHMEAYEAKMDSKESEVFHKYFTKLEQLNADAEAGAVSLGNMKCPKLPPKALELKTQLDKFAASRANDGEALRKAASIQRQLLRYETAAQRDFESYQQNHLARMREDVLRERDNEITKLRKKRADGRHKLAQALQAKADLLEQRTTNYKRGIDHDHTTGLHANVMYGVTPKRSFPVIAPDTETYQSAVESAAELGLPRPSTSNFSGTALPPLGWGTPKIQLRSRPPASNFYRTTQSLNNLNTGSLFSTARGSTAPSGSMFKRRSTPFNPSLVAS